MTTIATTAGLPSDGCITTRGWEHGSRRRGWHVEKILYDDIDYALVSASPMNITTGQITGAPRNIRLRFGLDTVEAMA